VAAILRCNGLGVSDVRKWSISAQIRWVIEPLSLVSCSFNFGHAGDRLRHGS
jgi:hypothetical protein